MIVNKNKFFISKEDYLEGERVSPIKHEYKRGQVYAMAGAKNPHVLISMNVSRRLGNYLDETECVVFMADTKVRIEAVDSFYYPDVVVTCDERDISSTEDFISYPSLVVEVLSPKTAAFDRGEKFADYRTLETLQEYVLIEQSQIRVECFRRNDEGNWVSQTYGQGDEVYLASVDFSCAIASIYQKVPGII